MLCLSNDDSDEVVSIEPSVASMTNAASSHGGESNTSNGKSGASNPDQDPTPTKHTGDKPAWAETQSGNMNAKHGSAESTSDRPEQNTILLAICRILREAISDLQKYHALCQTWKADVQSRQEKLDNVQDALLFRGLSQPSDIVSHIVNILHLRDSLSGLPPKVKQAQAEAVTRLESLKIEYMNNTFPAGQKPGDLSDGAYLGPFDKLPTSAPYDGSTLLRVDQLYRVTVDVELELDGSEGSSSMNEMRDVYDVLAHSMSPRKWSHLLGPHQDVQDAVEFYGAQSRWVEKEISEVNTRVTLQEQSQLHPQSMDSNNIALRQHLKEYRKQLDVASYLVEANLLVARYRAAFIPDIRPDDEDICLPEEFETEPEVTPAHYRLKFELVNTWLSQISGFDDDIDVPEVDDWPAREVEAWDNHSSYDDDEYYDLYVACEQGVERGLMQAYDALTKYVKTAKYPVIEGKYLISWPYTDISHEAYGYSDDPNGTSSGWYHVQDSDQSMETEDDEALPKSVRDSERPAWASDREQLHVATVGADDLYQDVEAVHQQYNSCNDPGDVRPPGFTGDSPGFELYDRGHNLAQADASSNAGQPFSRQFAEVDAVFRLWNTAW